MLAIGGLLLQSTLPISVTFAQSFVKGGAATVSSLMMGFAWGMGSLAVPADRRWAPTASASSATLTVAGVHPAAGRRAGVAAPRRGTGSQVRRSTGSSSSPKSTACLPP